MARLLGDEATEDREATETARQRISKRSNGVNEENGGLAGRVRLGRAPRGLIGGAIALRPAPGGPGGEPLPLDWRPLTLVAPFLRF